MRKGVKCKNVKRLYVDHSDEFYFDTVGLWELLEDFVQINDICVLETIFW